MGNDQSSGAKPSADVERREAEERERSKQTNPTPSPSPDQGEQQKAPLGPPGDQGSRTRK